jgi:coenzyme F420-0:L-glutamate ligase/coenzyme F420-1:gamma-L-glutamate ligase
MASSELRIIPVRIVGEIKPGDSLTEKILRALTRQRTPLQKGDILVVKHKIVSKAEGQAVELSTIKPSRASRKWAADYGLDPRVIELSLSQSNRIVRRKRGVFITETHHGFICANSGVDVSNVDGGKHALLLPEDPDQSAARLQRDIKKHLQLKVPVIISDSFGRPWREGLTEVAIGVAGMKPLYDYRRKRDAHGYVLHASVEAVADELACAAGLVCGKLESSPACVIRGFRYQPGRGSARELIRPVKNDLFR